MRRSDVVELTERLVAAPSPNPPGDERAAAGVVTEICTELGLPAPRVLAAEPSRPNLIVDLDFGPGGRQLALSGHLDTKPVGDAVWSSDPFVGRVDDGHLYGLGACDMKGAVAAMLSRCRRAGSDGPTAGRLSLVFTADEEHGSAYGSRYLAESGAVRADAIVIGEPGGIDRDWDELQTISRGIANFSIDVYGDQGHSSLSDSKGFVSATQECARLLVRFADRFHPSFNPSMSGLRPTVNAGVRIEGGVGFGVVPGKASFAVDELKLGWKRWQRRGGTGGAHEPLRVGQARVALVAVADVDREVGDTATDRLQLIPVAVDTAGFTITMASARTARIGQVPRDPSAAHAPRRR